MVQSVKDILNKTNQQVELVDDDKKINYAREMAGFAGWRAAFFGRLGIREFKMIVEGKRLIMQKKKAGHH